MTLRGDRGLSSYEQLGEAGRARASECVPVCAGGQEVLDRLIQIRPEGRIPGVRTP